MYVANTVGLRLPATSFEKTTFSNHQPWGDIHEPASTDTQESAQTRKDAMRHVNDSENQGHGDMGAQQENAICTIPYKFAYGTASRCTGIPLATILEQSSYSTLKSRRSCLNADRFLSLQLGVSRSTDHALQVESLETDKEMVERVSEDVLQQEQESDAEIDIDADVDSETRGKTYSVGDEIMFTPSIFSKFPQPPSGRVKDLFETIRARSLEFARCVTPNTQTITRINSEPSSTMSALIAEYQESDRDMMGGYFKDQFMAIEPDRTSNMALSSLLSIQSLGSSVMSTSMSETQSSDGNKWTTNPPPSNHSHFPVSSTFRPTFESEINPAMVPISPSDPTSTAQHTWFFPMDLAESDLCSSTDTNHKRNTLLPLVDSKDSISIRQSCTNKNASDSNASPITPDTCAESTRSVSCCSTSYSGTVLGVDLDLCRYSVEFLHNDRFITSVSSDGFTQQMPGPCFQRSCTELSGPKETYLAKPTYRSMTSSALTSLLQVATASGIVQPNFNTTKTSFYSPSGNLIQPEGRLTPSRKIMKSKRTHGTVEPDYEYVSNNQDLQPETIYLPPARPSLMPMTTLPNPSAPLPTHLQHHHNYQNPEKSEITSFASIIESSCAVQGCDGIVRNNSAIRYDRLRQPQPNVDFTKRRRRIRSPRPMLLTLKSDIKACRSRLRTIRSPLCALHRQKRKAQNSKACYTDYCTMSSTHRERSPKLAAIKNKINSAHKKRGDNFLGAFAAHALRICFCQPYDGAGKQTPAIGCREGCCGKACTSFTKNNEDESSYESSDDLKVRKVHFASPEKDRAQAPRVDTIRDQNDQRRRGV